MGSVGMPEYNPAESLFMILCGFILLVVIGQLIIHALKAIYNFFIYQEKSQQINQKSNPLVINSPTSTTEEEFSWFALCVFISLPILRYILAVIYLWLIGYIILSHFFSLNTRVNHFDQYLGNLKSLLLAQLLIICFTCSVWINATQPMRKFIPWGLFIISLDIFIEMLLQWLRLPFFHWVQSVELLFSGCALLIIPTAGFLIFNYRYKLQRG